MLWKFYKVKTFWPTIKFLGHTASTSHLEPTGGCLARADQSGFVHCYQFQTGKLVSKHRASQMPIIGIQFGTNQRFLALSDKNG